MNDIMELFLASGVFTLLGVISLGIVKKVRSARYLILGYLMGSVIIAALFGVKYILLNALLFGLGCMSYAVYVLIKEFNQCSKELAADEKKKDE